MENIIIEFIRTLVIIFIGYKIGKRKCHFRNKYYNFSTNEGDFKVEKSKFSDLTKNYDNFDVNWKEYSGFIFCELQGLVFINNKDSFKKNLNLIKEHNARYFIFDLADAIKL